MRVGNLRVNKNTEQSGYSLIEISIVLIVIGLLLVPAIAAYRNYDKKQRWDRTESSISMSLTALGGFRADFGRYPCPASPTAVPGSAGYGLEECASGVTAGNCINGVCAETSPRTGGLILRGALPFKSMNLEEGEAYDGYLSRLTYAVTDVLTRDVSFLPNSGGIGLLDANGNSIVTPADSLEFILVSAGRNGNGAYSLQGAIGAPCVAGTLEGDNCDGDTVYRQALTGENFDDRVAYFSPIELSQWQRYDSDPDNIKLKPGNSGKVAIGVDGGTLVPSAESLVVRSVTAMDPLTGALVTVEPGTVNARPNPAGVGDPLLRNTFNTSKLCKYGATDMTKDCFSPALIGGRLADGGGMDCTEGGAFPDRFLVGIKDGKKDCRDEVYISCPAGQHIAGIDADRKIVCSAAPVVCAAQTVTPFCGGSATIPVGSGNKYVYSGKCYTLPDEDRTTFNRATRLMTFPEKMAYVDNWNTQVRNEVDCGPAEDTALTKDIYTCTPQADGTTAWELKQTHERQNLTGNWPYDSITSLFWRAEQSIAWSWSLSGSTQVTPDSPENNSDNHDCWCREDFRSSVKDCTLLGVGYSGQYLSVEKVKCPNTNSSRWKEVFKDARTCNCTPGTYVETKSCSEYLNIPAGSVVGVAQVSYNTSCVLNAPPTVVSADISDCRCPANPPIVTDVACPAGTTNSFTWNGILKTNVKEIKVKNWLCPQGTQVTSSAGGGWYGNFVSESGIPACSCDSSLTEIVEKACPPSGGYAQAGTIKYQKKWDCTLNGGAGDWEPEANWKLVDASGCKSCTINIPAGSPNTANNPYPLGKQSGEKCNCGIPERCYVTLGAGKHNIWNVCSCTP
ncbi:MAG: prepilin-type N-terminal cleavage/methylation domain-containing protein [Alphaproteobacteria bacterium]|nr:prepilin-type N-terminal cleavage/methylation domain-containing protein [Alphaproteobacteria bacterium]